MASAFPLHVQDFAEYAIASGEINALGLYFHPHLRRDQPPFSTGPDNPNLVAWNQSLRHLPLPVRVEAGEQISLWASRTEEEVSVGLRDVPSGAIAGGASDVARF